MEERTRPRAPSEEAELRRAASTALRPLHTQIPQWQLQASRLLTLGERGRIVTADHVAEAEALVEAIALAQEAFDKVRSGWTAKVASQSRVVDVDRALQSVARVAAEARRTLRNRP